MSIDTRLSRLAPALSGQERAILILEAWKEGRPEDPTWRITMPRDQSGAFNHYIALMNACNRFLGTYIGFLDRTAHETALRFMWYVDLALWQEHVDEIKHAIRLSIPEPITESEYRAKVEQDRSEWVPVEELAGYLAGQSEGWTDEDYEDGDEGERYLRDEAWARVVEEKVGELRDLVARGDLPGRGKGRALKIPAGAFDDFIGHTSAAVPQDYLSFRVLPDEQASQVGLDRAGLDRLQQALNGWNFDNPDGEGLATFPARAQAALRETIAFDLIRTWVALRSVEVILEEVTTQFNGTDPLKPSVRQKLEETRESLLSTAGQVEFFEMGVELREPLPEELDELRGFFSDVVARE